MLARKKTQQEHQNNYRHNDNIPFVFAYNQADDGREIHSLTLWNSENAVAAFLAQIHLARTKHTRSNTEERNAMLALPNSHCDLCRKRAICKLNTAKGNQLILKGGFVSVWAGKYSGSRGEAALPLLLAT